MTFSFRQLTKKQILALSLIAITAGMGLAINVRKKNPELVFNNETFRSSTAMAGASARNEKEPIRIGHALITLTPTGFYPSEITRPKGLFLLAVDNQIGNQGMALRLTRANGVREKEKSLVKGQLRWRELFDLNPGRYVLTEANHPNWICNINIIAQ
jgi:hypothetical protein